MAYEGLAQQSTAAGPGPEGLQAFITDVQALVDRRMAEVEARLGDPERSFATGIHAELETVPIFFQASGVGVLLEATPHNPHIVKTVADITEREQTMDPDDKMAPELRQLRIIQDLEHVLRTGDQNDKLTTICTLGLMAACAKPPTIPQSMHDAIRNHNLSIKKPGKETPEQKIFRVAVLALRRQAYAALGAPKSETSDPLIIRLRNQPDTESVRRLMNTLTPDQLGVAIPFVNRSIYSAYAMQVLDVLFSDTVSKEAVEDDIFVAHVRLLESSKSTETPANEALPDVAVEDVDWDILPAGKLADWGITRDRPEPVPSDQPASRSGGSEFVRARYEFPIRLAVAWSEAARLAARPLNRKPAAATGPAEEEPTYDERMYRLAILPERLPNGLVVEHAVGVRAVTGHAVIVWRGESGIQDGEIAHTWRDVFRYDKPHAYGTFVVRRMIFTDTIMERAIDALLMPLDRFNRHAAQLSRRA